MYYKQLLTTSVYLSCLTFSGLKITILKSRKPPSFTKQSKCLFKYDIFIVHISYTIYI